VRMVFDILADPRLGNIGLDNLLTDGGEVASLTRLLHIVSNRQPEFHRHNTDLELFT
jgi:hypothetical protein